MVKKSKKNATKNTKILSIEVSPNIYKMIDDYKKKEHMPKRYIIEEAVKDFIKKNMGDKI